MVNSYSDYRFVSFCGINKMRSDWQAKRSNFRHRPIGLGVQGLADAFLLMRYPFESQEAQKLNADIFETIYYAAMKASCELARRLGPYETYAGSPVSQGVGLLFVYNVIIIAVKEQLINC